MSDKKIDRSVSRCPDCHGSGRKPGTYLICETCGCFGVVPAVSYKEKSA